MTPSRVRPAGIGAAEPGGESREGLLGLAFEEGDVIGDAGRGSKLGFVAEFFAGERHVGLGVGLVEGAVRVVDVIRGQGQAEVGVERGDDLIERGGHARTAVVEAALGGAGRPDGAGHHVLHIDEIAPVLAAAEHAGPPARFHLEVKLVDHARGGVLVGLARAVDVEILQADDAPGGAAAGVMASQIVELRLAEGVDVGRGGRLAFTHELRAHAVGGGRGGVNDRGLGGCGVIQEPAEGFDVVVSLEELVVDGCVGDAGQVEDGVKDQVLELGLQIQARHVGGDEIAAESLQVLEIAGAEIIGHDDKRVRMLLLQGQRQVRTDKAGAAGHQNCSHPPKNRPIRSGCKGETARAHRADRAMATAPATARRAPARDRGVGVSPST